MTDEKTMLPKDFTDRMASLLKEEYPVFLASYEKERSYGLRFNSLKSDRETFLKRMPFMLEQIAWAEEGFYYRPEDQPGKHIYHEAGAYYIQEPSAMAAAEVLAPAPGERILDLCAAPGGKTTHIAGKMAGRGLLVSNEIIPNRAKILSQNVERLGIPNAVVCSETPERLAELFPDFFDRILVDAPCSGEGMFRKDETAVKEWSLPHVKMCADRQMAILEQAARMVRPGGVLVYSTCTFSAEENEGVISAFLRDHTEFSIERAACADLFAAGRGEWTGHPAAGIEHTMRLWPHLLKGEGHFIARLRKEEGLYTAPYTYAKERMQERDRGRKKKKEDRNVPETFFGPCMHFLQEEIGLHDEALRRLLEDKIPIPFGEHIYLLPAQMIPLDGMKVIRPGLHAGTNKKNRFEPAHALALYLAPEDADARYEMSKEEARRYLRGETFMCGEAQKGWTLLTTGGYSIGFGKAAGGVMKNHYPKGLR